MFNEPNCGWVRVEIGGENGFHGPASYLDNVPVMCLDAFINSYKSGNPVAIEFDAEGWMFVIVVDRYSAYVIVHIDEKPSIQYFSNTDRDVLAKELVNDIEKYMEEWIKWNPNSEEESELFEQKKMLDEKLEELKALIK